MGWHGLAKFLFKFPEKLTDELSSQHRGDGEQTRSFCFIDDCVAGIIKLMHSDYHEPLNLGQDRMISINELIDILASIAGIQVYKNHILGPQGVRGRNSDNTLVRKILDWEPAISLEQGLVQTYSWIENQVKIKLELDSKEI